MHLSRGACVSELSDVFEILDDPRQTSIIPRARARVSQQLSLRLPYYLTPEEAHRLVDAATNKRDRLLLRLLWEAGLRVSEAISLGLGDVSSSAQSGNRIEGCGGRSRRPAAVPRW